MITTLGILDKMEPSSEAVEDGRNRQLTVPRRWNALLCSHLGAPLPSFARLSAFLHFTLTRTALQPRYQREDFLERLATSSISAK